MCLHDGFDFGCIKHVTVLRVHCFCLCDPAYIIILLKDKTVRQILIRSNSEHICELRFS